MSKQTNSKTKDKGHIRGRKGAYLDYNLLAVVIILSCFGLIMLFSASSYNWNFFKRQAVFFVAAIMVALIASLVDYHLLVRLAPLIYVAALGLMAMVRVPFLQYSSHGAARWIKIGPITFQPSEIAKIAVILILAYQIVNFGKHITAKRNFFWMFFTVVIQFAGAYVLTDNLSTALIILGIGVIIVLVYYPKTKPLWIHIGVVVVLVIIAVVCLKYFVDPANVSSFRIKRILSWINRESDLSDSGYQVMQGLYAIGSGGFFGKGLGNSTQKISRIPEPQNDMIFSIICEELGLFGAILLLVLFGYLLYRLFYIAQNARDLYGSIIATGVMAHFSLQIILNIAVVLNLIPTTGVSLPFVSYGGTAIMFLMGEVGICLNISRQIRLPDTEKNS